MSPGSEEGMNANQLFTKRELKKKNAVNAQFQLSHNEGNVCSVHRVNKEFLYRPNGRSWLTWSPWPDTSISEVK